MKWQITLSIAIFVLLGNVIAQDYMIQTPYQIDGDDYYRLTLSLTLAKIDRRMFSDQGASEWVRVTARDNNGNETHGFSIGLTTDPGWHRVVFADYNRWIKSYGDNTGDIQFNRPHGIAKARWVAYVLSNGNHVYSIPIYIADSGNNRIVELELKMMKLLLGGRVTILQYRREFTGIGSNAGAFNYPMDVAYQADAQSQDPDDGNLWIADTGKHRIVRIRLSDGQITGTWGSYGNGIGKFIYPSRLAIAKDGSGSDIYVVDSGNLRIARFRPVEQQDDSKIRSVDPTISWLDEAPFNGRFYYGLYNDAYGYLWAVDEMNHALVHFDENLNVLFAHGSYGTGQTQQRMNRPIDTYRFDRNVFQNGQQSIEYTDVTQVTEEWTSGSGQLKFQSIPKMIDNSFGYAHISDEEGCGVANTIHPECYWAGTTFTFKVSDICRMSMRIYNAEDQYVRTVFSNKLYLPGDVQVSWDGKDEEGEKYDDCNYYVRLTIASIFGYPIPDTRLFNIPVPCGNSNTLSKTAAGDGNAPETFEVFPNYPNPFNGITHIRYQLPQPGKVKITIYNILGQQVKTLLNETQEAGVYTLPWPGIDDAGNGVASGVYFLRTVYESKTTVKIKVFKTLYIK